MSNEVWYRKWRPQRFAEVAGQEHVSRTLANAVANRRVSHAYLFCGPRGTGKTSTARILAKAVNCLNNAAGEPCNRCPSCTGVVEGRALDLIEMDAASNRGIDEIRSLRDKVGYSPTASAYKVYLIDEVHELTQHAFDALLKTLEEPPAHVIFALATTEAERVPATIVSRCQRYDFRRIRVADVTARLQEICRGERVELPPVALESIARRATGSLRDAVNLLEQVIASTGATPSLDEVQRVLGLGGEGRSAQLVRHALRGELASAFEAIAAALDDGIEVRQLHRAMLGRLRAMLLLAAGAEETLDLGEEAIADLRLDVAGTDPAHVLGVMRALAAVDFRADPLSSLPLELALADLSLRSPASSSDPRFERAATERHAPHAAAAGERRAASPARASQPRGVPDGLRSSSLGSVRPSEAGGAPLQRPSALEPPSELLREPSQAGASTPLSTAAGAPLLGGEITASAPDRPAVSQAVASIPHDGGSPGTPSLERVQEAMGIIYDRLSEQRSKARFFINSECNIMAIDEQTVTLTFKQDFIAAKFKSEEGGKHVRDLETTIEMLFGRPFHLQISVDPEVKRWRRPPPTRQTSHLLDEAEKLGLRRIEPAQPA